MRKLRILHTEWSNGWGGQEIRILDECLGMAERGHRVFLAGAPDGKLRVRATQAGLTFIPAVMRGPWDLWAVRQLYRLLRSRRIDILNTHSSVDSWVGGMAARLKGVPCVRTRHLSVKVKRHPLNIVYRLPRAVTTTGVSIRRHLIDHLGLAEDKVFSIPTGVNTDRFAPSPPDPALWDELELSPGSPVVGIVAVLRSWKRHDLFCQMALEVARRHPRARFLIVGDGPGRQRVAGYLRDLGLEQSARMTGHREDPQRLMNLMDVCVLASDQAEGVPQAVLQELSCQRPVVAADAGDVGQVVIDGQTGLLVAPGSAQALAEGVLRVLADPDLAARLGQTGRRLVLDKHSREAMLLATEEVYASVLPDRA